MYGLIFLFKYNGEKPTAPVSEDANADGVFFASQVIQGHVTDNYVKPNPLSFVLVRQICNSS